MILDKYPDAEFYTADGYDNAIIGVCEKSMKLIYSVSKILEILTEDGMTEEDAMEWFSYNIEGAYISDREGNDVTPIYCNDIL